MNENKQDALQVLKNFIIVMSDWEVVNYQRVEEQGLAAIHDEAQLKLREIFAKYCTIKERKYGKPDYFSIGWPAKYSSDEEILSVEEVKKNRVQITTRHILYKTVYEYRYTLHYKNQEWRIDKKEKYDPELEKWVKWLL
ncbi:NTF2 fold immunity protein [Thorsellia anophelis]|uniref:NTF2 fold immunity protein n=1 Tax=Thorsellia anophelis DSM 18579 TaxID=1123402 RepID=A0A1I0FLH4_9GAMM|nr:NTF2 fold immunity protein [Thorsellia anophelis]SET59163.1 NTF2 fold immunity protein [Thorsellia anophelis DSM 18579]